MSYGSLTRNKESSTSGTSLALKSYYLRCRIVSVECSCDAEDVFWCAHAVALALARIRGNGSGSVAVRPPISGKQSGHIPPILTFFKPKFVC